jgi:hypothetical protein
MLKYFLAILFLMLPAATLAQSRANLIENPAAEHGTDAWRADGEAFIEEFDGGRFRQTVDLPAAASGKFALFIGHVSGERVASDITDRPYLYGLTVSADGRRILLHNQAETMRSHAERPNQWTKVWGIFPVPDGSSSISFQLGQALRRASPHTGSVARFDDVGLLVFETRRAAEEFVLRYR